MRNIEKSFAAVAGLIVLNKGVSYLREQGLAGIFGATESFDAYAVAISVTGILFGLAGNGISAVIIPKLKAAELRSQEAHTGTYTSAMIASIFTLAVIAGLQYILAPDLIGIIAPGLSPHAAAQGTFLLRLLAPSTVLMGYWIIAGSVLNTAGEFALPIYIPVFMDLIILGAVTAFGERLGIEAAVFGFLAGNLVQGIVLALAIKNRGFSLRLRSFELKSAISILLPALPVALNSLLSNGMQVVDKYYASNLGSGVISCLHYSSLIVSIPTGIFAIAIGTVIFPTLSELIASGDNSGAKREARKSITLSLAIGAASCIIMVLGSEMIVRLLFGRGRFGSDAIAVTAMIVRYQSLSIPAISISAIMEKMYYAKGQTVWPLAGIVLGTAAFAAVQNISVHWLPAIKGPAVIGLGYTVSAWVSLLMLTLRYKSITDNYTQEVD